MKAAPAASSAVRATPGVTGRRTNQSINQRIGVARGCLDDDDSQRSRLRGRGRKLMKIGWNTNTMVKLDANQTAPPRPISLSTGIPPNEIKIIPAMSARIDNKPGGSITSVVVAHASIL